MGINTESVNKQIYDLIKKDILERRLRPGEKIDTKGIAEHNHVSVMPVRDALQQLVISGLVLNRERVGFFVRKFSADEISQIMEMRIMFELHCMRKHLWAIDKARVRSLLEQVEQATSYVELDELDNTIHRTIVLASHNPFLIDEYDNLSALFSLGVFGGEEENVYTAKAEHIEILKAILDDDAERATSLLCWHLKRARDEIVGMYKEEA